jgi:hypothetical protein
MKKKLLSVLIASALSFSSLTATPKPIDDPTEEGMWLLSMISSMNYKDMKAKGLKLTPEQIYSVNQASLKDAVVSFGGFCTGEMVSGEGLLITNHHCGYGQIQSHSTVEKDYLTNGFWAMKREDELPNQGLTATFIIRVEDVTAKILKGLPTNATEEERRKWVEANTPAVIKEATEGTHYGAIVRPMFYGGEYYLFVTETFKDVRLVGTPPENIGKFGGDTDNWMWPRHTGDFSVFRVYAGKDNKPADYSKDNVPLKPRHFFPISLKGVKQNDFTMVMGFPGRTQEYLTSYAVQLLQDEINPKRVALRNVRLRKMKEFMEASPAVRIQYSAKYASIANYWKKWDGENRGLKRANTIAKKRTIESEFDTWVKQDKTRQEKYGYLMPSFVKTYSDLAKVDLAREYFGEAILAIEILDFAYDVADVVGKTEGKLSDEQVGKLRNLAKAFYKDFHAPLDKEIFKICIQAYKSDVRTELHPAYFPDVESVYNNSVLASQAKFEAWLAKGESKGISDDEAVKFLTAHLQMYSSKISPITRKANAEIDLLQRTYINALREMQPIRKFYPDANSTLRLTYGKIDDYFPADGVYYAPTTTLEGVFEKEKIVTEYNDYIVSERLRELYLKKDYGDYGMNGQMPVCFTASNHTTGGNSGSPIINAKGELIGVNFDRNWEGTMSDISYDITRVRNIGVDIRYVLFIIDKFAGASHLVKEMKLVK